VVVAADQLGLAAEDLAIRVQLEALVAERHQHRPALRRETADRLAHHRGQTHEIERHVDPGAARGVHQLPHRVAARRVDRGRAHPPGQRQLVGTDVHREHVARVQHARELDGRGSKPARAEHGHALAGAEAAAAQGMERRGR
jgi:hypothetical protein